MASYPYFNGLAFDPTRRKNATRESTQTLKAWLSEHMKNPYPTKGEKIMLAIITKMTLTQVSTWFANARRRLKKDNRLTWSSSSRSSAAGDDDQDDDVDNVDNDDDDDVIEPGDSRHGNTSSKALPAGGRSDGYDSDDADTRPPADQHPAFSQDGETAAHWRRQLHGNGGVTPSYPSNVEQQQHGSSSSSSRHSTTLSSSASCLQVTAPTSGSSMDAQQQRQHQHHLSPLRFGDARNHHQSTLTPPPSLVGDTHRHTSSSKSHSYHHHNQLHQNLASPHPSHHLASSTSTVPLSPDQLQRKPKIWSLADVATSGFTSDVTSRDATMTSHTITSFGQSEPVHSFIT
jgi:hypothetical protein